LRQNLEYFVVVFVLGNLGHGVRIPTDQPTVNAIIRFEPKVIGEQGMRLRNPQQVVIVNLGGLIDQDVPTSFVGKVGDVGEKLMGNEDDMPAAATECLQPVQQFFGDFSGKLVAVEHHVGWGIGSAEKLVLNRFVDEFLCRLDDEHIVASTSEFTGATDNLMGFAGAANRGRKRYFQNSNGCSTDCVINT